jgi:phenylalanyl-tRNA synthetase beta chain
LQALGAEGLLPADDVDVLAEAYTFCERARNACYLVTGRPSDEDLASLDAALPAQPRHAGIVLAGRRQGRDVDWADAVEAVMALGRALGLSLAVQGLEWGPFHPGRCAEVLLEGRRVGLAGELHPRVTERLLLPSRTVAAECNLDMLVATAEAAGPAPAPLISAYPPASVDIAVVVDADVAAAEVERALREGAGELLEDIGLFDVYVGPQVGEGRRSLAYSLRLRAPDRTLTDPEVLGARDAAVAEAARRHGAVLRSA